MGQKQSGILTIKIGNATYTGSIVDGVLQGDGIIDHNSQQLRCEFRDNVPVSPVTIVAKNFIYTGEFDPPKNIPDSFEEYCTGKGKKEYKDRTDEGTFYKGFITSGTRTTDLYKFVGNFAIDKPINGGKLVIKDLSIIHGLPEFHNFTGTFQTEKNTYTGALTDGAKQGEWITTYSSGNRLIYQYSNNKQVGKVKYLRSNSYEQIYDSDSDNKAEITVKINKDKFHLNLPKLIKYFNNPLEVNLDKPYHTLQFTGETGNDHNIIKGEIRLRGVFRLEAAWKNSELECTAKFIDIRKGTYEEILFVENVRINKIGCTKEQIKLVEPKNIVHDESDASIESEGEEGAVKN